MSQPLTPPVARVIWLDAAVCALTGAVLAAASGPVSGLTAIPAALVFWAGMLLLPIAAFMAFVASRRPVPAWGVVIVVAGNVGWVLASLALLLGIWFVPNALGMALIAGQAVAVLFLAWLEYAASRPQAARAN